MAAPSPFQQTTRALAGDGNYKHIVWLVLVLLIALAWAWWALASRIPLYKRSEIASLQLMAEPSDISAKASGSVQKIHVKLGDEVRVGDLLITLEHDAVNAAVRSSHAVLQSLVIQREALNEEQHILVLSHERAVEALIADIAQRQEHLDDAGDIDRLQAQIAQRFEQSRSNNLSSEIDVLEAKKAREEAAMELNRRDGDLEGAKAQLYILRQNHLQEAARLRRQDAEVQESLALQQDRLAQLMIERDKFVVHAPFDGVVAAMADLQLAQFVRSGESLGTLLPRSELSIVAYFRPSDALGHIASGQSARVEILGFPSLQYGVLPARVTRVASAVKDGHLRATLEFASKAPARIPLQHDLPVVIDVNVGQMSPWQVLLHTAGIKLNSVTTATVPQ